MEETLNIEDFKEFVQHIKATYKDEQLDMILKISINALWIMFEQGHDMPRKTLIELQKQL